jgi:hypothetical protein
LGTISNSDKYGGPEPHRYGRGDCDWRWANTLFQKDKWHQGKRVKEIAPTVYGMVPKRIINKRKVSEALLNLQLIFDFEAEGGGAFPLRVLMEFFLAL